MNIWHDINGERIKKDNFVSVIEIQKNGRNKYELDKETGMLRLDRILYTATHYPANYGFIPRTYAGDGDPLDVLVICHEEIVPLTLVETYPIGVLKMIDGGEEDEKIIAIPVNDPYLNNYKNRIKAVIKKLQDGTLPASKGGLIGTMRGISEYDSLASIKALYDAASDVDLFYSKECQKW